MDDSTVATRTADRRRPHLPARRLACCRATRCATARRVQRRLHDLLRRCALAVLTAAARPTTRARRRSCTRTSTSRCCSRPWRAHRFARRAGDGVRDGDIIRGVAERLFAVVRDLAYTAIDLGPEFGKDLATSGWITNAVFGLLRNARILHPADPNLVVCWAGTPSARRVRIHQDVATSSACGARHLHRLRPRRHEGPDEGATIAHAKQRRDSRATSASPTGIIAAESPNPIVTTW